jgi:cellulose synthase/poly-beta-1,6-N-acetylglucosamine synthase-like glycosyltransferase
VIGIVTVAVLTVTSLLLFAFGLNLLYLTVGALRLKPRPPPAAMTANEPRVCVQLPIYNERYVAERVVDAVCAVDWPRDRFEVQVLDDSDDETVQILARRIAHWQRHGVQVAHVRRGSRRGFKAGALAYGLEQTAAPFIAIFDADFVPPPDFLRRTIGSFDDESIAFVQSRWGHLDEGYSWFTRLQALFIDFHFLVEQAVRSARGYFVNFTGSAGVWRRAAIVDSGGWTANTLTEDLDLSYRAQLRGWKAAYLEDLVVPEELPVSIDAYRSQQSRWATGSFQCAFRLLRPVWRSSNRLVVKVEATIHLLAYGVGPLMLLQLICYPTLLLSVGRNHIPWQLGDALLLGVCVAISPWLGFIVAQTRRGRRWWAGIPSVFCQVIGAGMSINVILALLRAFRPGGTFVRTPKHHIVRRGQEWRDQDYVRVGDPRALLEGAFGLGTLAMLPLAIAMDQALLAVYAALFAMGFFTVAALSLVDWLEVVTLRRLGRRALGLMRAIAPVTVLGGLVTVLLLLAAQMAEPFEDGYAHWLIAANLASTGHLHDPLFGMEDSWLPGYHVLSAAVLHLFGLWQLGALKALSALFGVAIAACVYALAPNLRQARLAVALLVLNPVFLFTSGSAVVEPMVTALLTAGGLAAVRGRMKLAAILAALACVTSTKAWIWVAAAVLFVVVEAIRSRPARFRARSVAWAVPALGLLLFLQLGFAPAGHSMARGTVEVMSATARGSIPAGGVGRLVELATTCGLAGLPLFAFGVIGLVLALRRHATALWRFVYAPALLYLIAVFGLVAVGAYSGSHRYLYPALPAIALLAAAALDRYVGAVRLATIAAAALLAVAFVPVFSAFAAQDAGLAAAGKATACTNGVLLTDSPVAAYFSGKPPSQISGTQALPLDQAEALAWIESHRVTSLVVEDISYYRATAVFPGLAKGTASPPFASLGGRGRFQVPGGKSVYAFEVGDACLDQSIYPGVEAEMLPMPAEGKTAALAKGVALRVGTAQATGEGMGFGVPIVRYGDGWVYSRTSNDANLSTPDVTRWKRTFNLDEIGGDKAHGYTFVPIASRGQIEVTYTIDGGGIAIDVKPVWLAPGYDQVGILNEQSAAFDDFATDDQPTAVGQAFGSWIAVTGHWARLRSSSLGVEWSVPAIPGAALHAGRELISTDFDWAGLDYIFSGEFTGATYRIGVQEAR